MKILLFYFSGAGYTRWAVNRLSGMLLQNGHTVHVEAVENCEVAGILKREDMVDAVGFAQPIYAADMPRIMRRAIRAVLDAAAAYPALPTKVFFLNTCAYVNGYGYPQARKLFRGTPFQIQAYVSVKMPNSALGKTPDLCPRTIAPGEALEKEAQRGLDALARSLETGERLITGRGPQALGGVLVRNMLRRQILGTYALMRVDLERCTFCMRCVGACPVHCIQYTDAAGFAFTDACEACMRCVHACPARAISVK